MTILRRWIGGATVLALIWIALTTESRGADPRPDEPTPAPGSPPPIVVVVFDALRADHLGAYGYAKRPTSPAFDALARESYVFERVRTAAPYTLASVATLLTGRPPDEHTLIGFDRALPTSIPTLPRMLAPSGYRSLVASRSGILSGFGIEDAFDQRFVDPKLTGDLRAFRRRWKASVTELAAGKSPWFAYLHFFPPHAPYRPPRAFVVPFAVPDVPGVSGAVTYLESLDRGEAHLDPAGLDALTARYDANVRYADHELADLLDFLRPLGVLDRAWVVVTADHGEAFGEHGRFEHNSTVYDEMLRVPLVVRPPGGLREPVRIAEGVGLIDLAPTVLRWARVLAAENLAGRPLPLAGGLEDHRERARPVTSRSASPPERFAITDGHWKYVRALAAADAASEELYDLDADPGERTDLAAGQPARLGVLRAAAQRELELERSRAPEPRFTTAMQPDVAEALRALGYVR